MSTKQEPLLERIPLLVPINNLPSSQQEQLIERARVIDLRRKDYVFHQGDRDEWSYYVLEGEIEMYADDQLIKRVKGGEGESFHALSQLQPRQMSARAKTKVKILQLNRNLLDRFLSAEVEPAPSGPEIEVTEIASAKTGHWLTDMLQSELFSRVPPSNIQKLLATIETVEFKAGEVVIEQGSVGDYYYAIQSGSCEVLRSTHKQKEIKLANLGPGDRFGEEALVSETKRNATVRMVTDGELARLTKNDFIELIKKPVLHSVSLDEARKMVAENAVWLDVRFPEEAAINGLEGSINIPLSLLRTRTNELHPETNYLAYCDTGGRSSAAAFLLTQEGFNVAFVEGGAIDEVATEPALETGEATTTGADAPPPPPKTEAAPAARATEAQPKPPSEARATAADEAIEAEARAQSLAAELEKARLQIEQAKRLMADAETAKREADRFVQQRLEKEREKLHQDAEQVQAKLEEAEKLRDQIEKQQRAAAEEAEKRHAEQQAHTTELQNAAEEKLHAEERRIEALYRKQTEQMEKIEAEHEKTKAELEQAWASIETETTLSQERLLAARELEAELERKEKAQARKIAEQKRKLRKELQDELAKDRGRLEAEFARTAEEIERARRDQQAAEAAKRAAAEEAKKIIEEYKAAHDELFAEQQAKLDAERKLLQEHATRVKAQLEEAIEARAEAERIKQETENQLVGLRTQKPTADSTELDLRAQIEAIEKRAHDATEQLRVAIATESDAAERQRETEQKLERTYESATEINLMFQKELDEWVAEQERIQTSTAQRKTLNKQDMQTVRIKKRATRAKDEAAAHDLSLLDEIAAQLDEDA